MCVKFTYCYTHNLYVYHMHDNLGHLAPVITILDIAYGCGGNHTMIQQAWSMFYTNFYISIWFTFYGLYELEANRTLRECVQFSHCVSACNFSVDTKFVDSLNGMHMVAGVCVECTQCTIKQVQTNQTCMLNCIPRSTNIVYDNNMHNILSASHKRCWLFTMRMCSIATPMLETGSLPASQSRVRLDL
jgi:hypothetical protein